MFEKSIAFPKHHVSWWQMKVELTIPIILVVTITVKQPAASARQRLVDICTDLRMDVEFGVLPHPLQLHY